MFLKLFLVSVGSLFLVSCSGNPVGSADNINMALTGSPWLLPRVPSPE